MEELIRKVVERYRKSPQTLAVFLTGNTAEGREGSDIDIGVITKDQTRFDYFWEDGVLVEITKLTLSEARKKLKDDSMFLYFLLGAKAVWDPQDLVVQLKKDAQKAYKDYKMKDEEFEKIKYWITSLKLKIQKAQSSGDFKKASFYATTGLWKVLEGYFALSDIPMPPAASVLSNIPRLKVKPVNFDELFDTILEGDAEKRSKAALSLIDFFLDETK